MQSIAPGLRGALAAAAVALPLSLLAAAPAAAQKSGNYVVQGTSPDGSSYSGTVQFQSAGAGTWRLTWRVGGAPIEGSAITTNGRIAAGYVLDGAVGVALYEEQPDGSLLGRWTTRTGGVGTERLTPQ